MPRSLPHAQPQPHPLSNPLHRKPRTCTVCTPRLALPRAWWRRRQTEASCRVPRHRSTTCPRSMSTLRGGYRGHYSAMTLHDETRLSILNMGASLAPTAAASPIAPAPPPLAHVPNATLKMRARPARTPVSSTSTNRTATATATATASVRARRSRATGRGAHRWRRPDPCSSQPRTRSRARTRSRPSLHSTRGPR
jgi:hypothetical protein